MESPFEHTKRVLRGEEPLTPEEEAIGRTLSRTDPNYAGRSKEIENVPAKPVNSREAFDRWQREQESNKPSGDN